MGEWAAAFIQPPVPITDLEETSFDNPFLNQLITILATILLPVKDRRRFVQEFRMRHKWDQGDCDQVFCMCPSIFIYDTLNSNINWAT